MYKRRKKRSTQKLRRIHKIKFYKRESREIYLQKYLTKVAF